MTIDRETFPSPNSTIREQNLLVAELLERFSLTKIKIAIQKDGELTEISRQILGEEFQIKVPGKTETDSSLVSVSEDGETGYLYARNKSICALVTTGAVDLAVVGIDRLIEDGVEEDLEIISSYEEEYSWPLILATPADSEITSIKDIKRIATQYPIITQRYLATVGVEDIEVLTTVGGTEIYPYLDLGEPIDAIVDMSVTGRSLRAHNLAAWTPSIGQIYPVLVRKKEKVDA